MAVSPKHGRGVTSLTQLTKEIKKDQKTGRETSVKYSDEELDKMEKARKNELYDQCRYVRLIIELPTKDEREQQYEELMKRFSDFKIVRILLDRSGSMDEENHRFAGKIANALANDDPNGFASPDRDNAIVTFSNVVDWQHYHSLKTKKDLINFMDNAYTHGGDEHQLLAARQMAKQLNDEFTRSEKKKLDNEGKRVGSAIIVLSDDGVNDFTPTQLRDLVEQSEKSNITIFFALINDKSKEKLITVTDAKGLLNEFDDFVKSFDHDAYFPKVRMTDQQKKNYVFEIMEKYRTEIDAEHCGVQLDEHGNIRFKFAIQRVQENIGRNIMKRNKRYWGERKRLIEQYQSERQGILDWEKQSNYRAIPAAEKLRQLTHTFQGMLSQIDDPAFKKDPELKRLVSLYYTVDEK